MSEPFTTWSSSRRPSNRRKWLVIFTSIVILGFSLVAAVVIWRLQRTQTTDTRSDASVDQNFSTRGQFVMPEYQGFMVHLYLDDSTRNSGQDIESFYRQVDEIVALGIPNQAIRVGLDLDVILKRTSQDMFFDCQLAINCNPAMLDRLEEALQYANQKGLKIAVVTYVPYLFMTFSEPSESDLVWRQKLPLQEYSDQAYRFHLLLGQRFGEYVDIWNLFNESNYFAFDSHRVVERSSYSQYLDNFEAVYQASKRGVKEGDMSGPNFVTHDLAWLTYPEDQQNWFYSEDFLNKLADELDFISFNVYNYQPNPTAGRDQIFKLVNRLGTRYRKQVAISETGFCASDLQLLQQQSIVGCNLVDWKLSSNLKTLFVYQFQDNLTRWYDRCQQSFGVVTSDAKPKAAVDYIEYGLKYAGELSRSNLSKSFANLSLPVPDPNFWERTSKQTWQVVNENDYRLEVGQWLIWSERIEEGKEVSAVIDSFAVNGNWLAPRMIILSDEDAFLYEFAVQVFPSANANVFSKELGKNYTQRVASVSFPLTMTYQYQDGAIQFYLNGLPVLDSVTAEPLRLPANQVSYRVGLQLLNDGPGWVNLVDASIASINPALCEAVKNSNNQGNVRFEPNRPDTVQNSRTINL